MYIILLILCLLTGFELTSRESSAPYITGDTFRAYCNHVFDDADHTLNPGSVNDGDTIFVKTDYLSKFFDTIHPKINTRYIIITHNCSYSVPDSYESYLESDKIIAWFGTHKQYCDHPKMHNLPNGLENRRWPRGNYDIIRAIEQSLSKYSKKIFLYMCFAIDTCQGERTMVRNMLKSEPYCTCVTDRSFEEYLKDVAQSVFVLSPRGLGIDCFRTWEALLLGAIPIIKTSDLDPLFEDLPVLIINSWTEVTLDFLLEKYQEIQQKPFNKKKLYCQYWFDYIDSFKPTKK